MSEDLAALLVALVDLSSGQLLMLSLGLAASVLLAFPIGTRTHICVSFQDMASVIWSLAWCAMPNALADWLRDCNRHHMPRPA